MDRVARRAHGVVVQDQPVARVLLDQFARREMMLEIDDHLFTPWPFRAALRHTLRHPLPLRERVASEASGVRGRKTGVQDALTRLIRFARSAPSPARGEGT